MVAEMVDTTTTITISIIIIHTSKSKVFQNTLGVIPTKDRNGITGVRPIIGTKSMVATATMIHIPIATTIGASQIPAGIP
jgi:hypothetical protein